MSEEMRQAQEAVSTILMFANILETAAADELRWTSDTANKMGDMLNKCASQIDRALETFYTASA